VDHIDTVFQGDSDDVLLRQVSSYGTEPLADLVRFIGLNDQKISRCSFFKGLQSANTFCL
jgi:hypothetical protein